MLNATILGTTISNVVYWRAQQISEQGEVDLPGKAPVWSGHSKKKQKWFNHRIIMPWWSTGHGYIARLAYPGSTRSLKCEQAWQEAEVCKCLSKQRALFSVTYHKSCLLGCLIMRMAARSVFCSELWATFSNVDSQRICQTYVVALKENYSLEPFIPAYICKAGEKKDILV